MPSSSESTDSPGSGDPPKSPDDDHVLIGVCTFNEAENIATLIAGLRNAIPVADILVIDDDSPDGTASIVSDLARRDTAIRVVVRHERGLGGAIRHAMTQAIDEGYAFFLNLDGDLSHDPDQLGELLDRARKSPEVDVVIGSRYVDGGKIVGWPIHRKLMSRMVNRFATACLRLPVKDCSGSMRCYRIATLRRVGMPTFRSNGYAVLEELLVGLHRRGAKFIEVPIAFTDRQKGKSKLTLREAVRSSAQIVAMAVKR